jgi:nucleoside-diphosphate-sugar epimerase
VLRTSRLFPEPDDDAVVRDRFSDANVKANEFLYRRVDREDVVTAHLLAAAGAPELGFGRYIVSATTPFRPVDVARLDGRAHDVVCQRVPEYRAWYQRIGWRMFERIDRVYDNGAARRDLGWTPRYAFATLVRSAMEGGPVRSPLAELIGAKGYHDERVVTFIE